MWTALCVRFSELFNQSAAFVYDAASLLGSFHLAIYCPTSSTFYPLGMTVIFWNIFFFFVDKTKSKIEPQYFNILVVFLKNYFLVLKILVKSGKIWSNAVWLVCELCEYYVKLKNNRMNYIIYDLLYRWLLHRLLKKLSFFLQRSASSWLHHTTND